MPIRFLITTLLLWVSVAANADESVSQLIARGAWRDAQLKIYDRAWLRKPDSQVLISMARSGLSDLALLRVDDLSPNVRSNALVSIAKENKAAAPALRTHILEQALHAAMTPDQQISVALAWIQLGDPKRGISITQLALTNASGSREYTRRIFDYLAFSKSEPIATALASSLVKFASAMPGDDDPYIFVDLAQLLGLADDVEGQRTALEGAIQRIALLPVGQQPSARGRIVDVALRNHQEALAASVAPQREVLTEWAGYYARAADYKKAEDLTDGMSDTLYVSHRAASLESTITEAIHNGDLNTASAMTQRLISSDSDYAQLQLMIGNAYWDAGQKTEASSAYAKAVARYLRLDSSVYSHRDTEILARLAHDARHHGQPRLGALVMDLMPTIIAKQSPKDLNAQVASRVYFSALLVDTGNRKVAATYLIDANERLQSAAAPQNKYGLDNLELCLAEGLGEQVDLAALCRGL